MLEAINEAQSSILIETFIWKNDETGQAFRDVVNKAAERGVKVLVIYDGFANLVVSSSFFQFHPDVQVYRFPVIRISMLTKTVRGTGLDHRKLLVVDDRFGFEGGDT